MSSFSSSLKWFAKLFSQRFRKYTPHFWNFLTFIFFFRNTSKNSIISPYTIKTERHFHSVFINKLIAITLLLLFSLSFLLYHDLKSLLNTYQYTSALLLLLALAFPKRRFVHLCPRLLVQGQRYNQLF